MKGRRPKHSKNTVKRARLLENSVEAVAVLGFTVYRGMTEARRHLKKGPFPARHIISPFAYPTLYGTPGKKEAYIYAEGIGSFLLEAKYQDGSGSVDEKMPYLWECFLISDKHWIVRFDGNWWRSKRGIAAIAWLRRRVAENSIERKFYIVTTDDEWIALVKTLFSGLIAHASPAVGDLFAADKPLSVPP